MNKTIMQILLNWQTPYITGTDLTIALNTTTGARHGIVKRAIQEGTLIRIHKDFYLIKLRHDQPIINLFEIAPVIYGPSYVSFESALQFHGWIPEAVPITTAATVKRSITLHTPVGSFAYYHIPIAAFPIGVQQVYHPVTLFIADPWKALADMMYVQKRSWQTLDALSMDMRIDMDKLHPPNTELLGYLSKNYPHQKTQHTLRKLLKYGH